MQRVSPEMLRMIEEYQREIEYHLFRYKLSVIEKRLADLEALVG